MQIPIRNAGVVNTLLSLTLRTRCVLAAVSLLLAASLLPVEAAETFEIVIKGGRIADGTGAPWYAADVGIREGKIAKIGRLDASSGQRTIDATGLIVAPGF